ncbi:MAG: peptidase S41, partial [Bacteroidaceae bacterium]|nr:peptidase S41 [Bacteroidaceae bacterium]
EVHNALTALSKKGMKKLIIDLQGNGGGFLNAAVDITNEFLAKDEMIVYTHGRAVRNESFKANGEGKYQKIPLVVLVDEYSASAAEILTGAIQDHDRGLVVGRRTFGKGLVQRPIDLPDGSMIRLTVAHYYTPSGRCIQKPYEKGNSEDYHKDIIHRFNKGEFTNIDSIHLVDSLKFTTLKQKRTVYGGGGIMPDYFIPLDTMKYARYHREVAAHSVLYNVVLQYIDRNRKSMNSKYPNFKAFMKKYDETEKILKEIREKATEQKITCTDDEWTKAKESLALQVKALVARDLFDMSEYFEIMNANNATVQKAIELLSKK